MEETEKTPNAKPGKSQDEIALDLMKFIATETGYGRGQGAVGFSGKNSKPPEEHVEALLGLFDRCRKVVKQEPAGSNPPPRKMSQPPGEQVK